MNTCVYCGHPNADGVLNCASCGSSLNTVSLQGLSAGALLQGGKYTITKALAQGGFGITYLALHVALNQVVVIKELCPQGSVRVRSTLQPSTTQLGSWQSAVSGFALEARTLASFNHPGIVKVQDVFEENNTAYFVMEALQGQTLSSRLAASVLTEAQALTLAQQIGAALLEVHGKGLLHRDLKPDNIFLEPKRGAVLIDFGSARLFSDKTVRHTQILTQGYAPPEQYASQAKFGPYTDIYALAATLYTALTASIPPDAYARANGVDLEFPAHVSNAWRTAIDRAMRFKIDERPQSVPEFLASLPNTRGAVLPQQTQWVGGMPPAVAPPSSQPSGAGARTAMYTPPSPASSATRRVFPLWLLVVPVIAAVAFGVYQYLPGGTGVSGNWSAAQLEVSADALNVRTGPDINAGIVQVSNAALRVVRDERVTVLDQQSGWYKVRVQNSEGWVSSRLTIPVTPQVSIERVKQLRVDVENQNTVTLEAGVYDLGDVLELTRGVEIVGAGWQSTVLISSARGSVLNFDSGGVLKLRNLTVAHVGSSPAAAAIVRGGGLEVSNVRFIGGEDTGNPSGDDGDGLVLRSDTRGTIDNAFFVGNRWRGLTINDNARVSVQNSVSRGNTGSGVVVSDKASPKLERNEIDGNGLMGVKVYNAASVILTDNKIESNIRGAIGFYDTSSGQVTGNTCASNGGAVIERAPGAMVQFGSNPGCAPNTSTLSASSAGFSSPPSGAVSSGGVEITAPPNREQFIALNRTRSLWNTRLDMSRSVNFSADVGEVSHDARAAPGEIYTWGVRWCNSSPGKLQADLQRVNLRLEANGVTVQNAQTYQGAETSSSGSVQYCHRKSTLVRAAPGAFVRLSVIGTVLTNDLKSDYNRAFEPGEHRMTMNVSFTGN